MTFIPTESFEALEAKLDDWISTTGAERRQGGVAPVEADGLAVYLHRIGWSPASTQDRCARERRIMAEVLVTASGPTSVEADGILGALLLGQPKDVATLVPVPSDSMLWTTLVQPPRPALLAACPLRLSPVPKPAPKIAKFEAHIGASKTLKGTVVGDDGPLISAQVGIAGLDPTTATDSDGHFRLAGWCGQPIAVSHRGTRRVFSPEPGSQDLTLTLAKES